VLAVRNLPLDTSVISRPGRKRPKLVFLVTEDWYFWSHRLPIARAARDAGFAVVVAAREREHGARIRGEGFRLEPLGWRRRGDGVLGSGRALAEIAALYRREQPDIVHHVALKPVLFGAAALRLAFPRRAARPVCIAAVNGLGSGFTATGGTRPIGAVLRWALRHATRGARIIVQNPEDGEALAALGIDPARFALIRGSGVDTAHFAPLPEPPADPSGGGTVTVALVGRMLRSKGVPDAVAAVRRLRAAGMAVELILAGPTDPDNPDSLDDRALASLAAEPGVVWLGRVEDVREVWAAAAIAVLPSTYGEGLPKALLEAASCGRAIVASDMPGCREIVRAGGPGAETGLLVPPGDVAALAEAIAALVRDPERRRAMGGAGRRLVERDFAEQRIAAQTLALYDGALRRREVAR
jgi:glycosyltransferase involved in cell wall biosynthesis